MVTASTGFPAEGSDTTRPRVVVSGVGAVFGALAAVLGALVTPMAAPEFDRLLKSESARWADVIRKRNIKAPE